MVDVANLQIDVVLHDFLVDEALRYLVSAGVVVPPGDAAQGALPGATAATPSRPNP